ncbi:MAG: hypothetical protein A3G13_01310 [Candidatus Levybacteria bacterium RIFCSPLOWO2_12_FULL_37_7]|nr:MAG: hypothetical protein A3G13_01310 [Candidatus Levybacteria bacterium RIFCSPLOWO2_12_FULL_37_7]
MNIRYCLPIVKNKKEKIVAIVQNNQNYSYFELWLDYIKDLDVELVKQLADQMGEKLILVFRRKNLEAVQLNSKKRQEIISLLNNSLALLDLDIFNQKEELEYIRANDLKIKTIISYHNYDQTPEDEKLYAILDTMKQYTPAIFKIATKCNSQKDALRLLELLLAMKEKHVKCIILGMGNFGMVTRIFGSIWGNEMIFAPITKSEESAEGQLTKKQLEKIFELL